MRLSVTLPMPRTVNIVSSDGRSYWSSAEVMAEEGKHTLRVEATDGEALWAGKLPFTTLASYVPRQLFDSTEVMIEHVFRLVYGVAAGIVDGPLVDGVECSLDLTVNRSRETMRACNFNFAIARQDGGKLEFKAITFLLKQKEGAALSGVISKLLAQREAVEEQLSAAKAKVDSVRALYQKTCRQLEESIALAERNERALLSKFTRVLNEKKRAFTELTTEFEASQQVHMESLAAAEPSPVKRPRGRPPGKGKGKARAKGKGRALVRESQLLPPSKVGMTATAAPYIPPSKMAMAAAYTRGGTMSETPALSTGSPQKPPSQGATTASAAVLVVDDDDDDDDDGIEENEARGGHVSDASTVSRADSREGNASLVRRDTELSKNGREQPDPPARDSLMSLMDNMSDDEGGLPDSDSDDAVVATKRPRSVSGTPAKRSRDDSNASAAGKVQRTGSGSATTPGTAQTPGSSRAMDELDL